MLKTLEEPASFVHLILLTDRLAEVLPTIRSRCQLVRFDAPSVAGGRGGARGAGRRRARRAVACARLALGDADARARAGRGRGAGAARGGGAVRARGARRAMARARPGSSCSPRCARGGTPSRAELEARAAAELELYPRKERKRVETEWTERIRRARRRVETARSTSALQLVALWFADLACLAWGAADLVRNVDRLAELEARTAGRDPAAPARGDRAGGGHAPALPAQRLRGSRMRGARYRRYRGCRATCCRRERPGPSGLRRPAGSTCEPGAPTSEFISLMRASRAFHRPWATAPTDDERVRRLPGGLAPAGLRGDARVPARGPRDPRLLQPLPDHARLAPERLPRLRRRQAASPARATCARASSWSCATPS